ncbi:DNA-binding protein [Robbsia andropogonis]|uniref:DNA-binding protein n=1 Tax=Robbsia andropogonis TaxID=28092 RepID=A0A0F5JTS6_9BURK|nr:PLP-dependent aminotransferase family protein [Robbsia andropogonis]KKB61246.1 DNA-binding protein [Robbsia andropogonis]MCP1120879.1 PLP-dependent aminotransferase family protein [Robbsia andropogonis]MCP1130659.1 PLP-dependent aminotransferase family protein [Robbsia andropogonis]
MKAALLTEWLVQRLDRREGSPLYRQLHRLLQQAILTQTLKAGTRLPSSRVLAAEIGLGRNTVTQVYEQLTLEGYVSAATGRGTYVADTSPDQIDGVTANAADAVDHGAAPSDLSCRGRRLIDEAGASNRQWGAFMPGVPDVSRFPGHVWTRLQNKYWRKMSPDLLTYASGGGLPALRRALADYLGAARMVQCRPEQIIITTGIHQSVDLTARLLSDPGDVVWTEEPGYWGVRSVMHACGLDTHAIPVDGEGMAPSPTDLSVPPKLILVTPSHQYPMGSVMSLARRRMLLEYARQHQCWVIEDDYDSEFRYGSRPLASLQGLDNAGRVIYVGSFGKTLFPGLRIGYVVVPQAYADAFAVASSELYREGQLMQQAVLAEFIAEGHFASHIRKMRALYGHRRQILLDAITNRYGHDMTLTGSDAGLHLVAQWSADIDDTAVTAAALARGILVRPLSRYFSEPSRAQSGWLLGYACVPDEQVRPAFDTLASVLDQYCKRGKKTVR